MSDLETFQHLGPDIAHTITLEIRQSVAAVEACKRAGIKQIVYSALDDLPDEMQVPHYASKAKGAFLPLIGNSVSSKVATRERETSLWRNGSRPAI